MSIHKPSVVGDKTQETNNFGSVEFYGSFQEHILSDHLKFNSSFNQPNSSHFLRVWDRSTQLAYPACFTDCSVVPVTRNCVRLSCVLGQSTSVALILSQDLTRYPLQRRMGRVSGSGQQISV